MNRNELLGHVRKVVVKIGTAALSDATGGLDENQITRIANQVHALRQRGLQVVIVSSGAIGAGVNELGLSGRPKKLRELQACAAVGQGRLTSVYDQCFRKKGYHAAQMLLTRDDFTQRRRYLNASNTIHALLDYGAVPLINENDTISVEAIELTFTDNDILAALVTNVLDADALVVLTVEDGLYENPAAPAGRRRVRPLVEKVTDDIRAMVTSMRSRGGTGGMASKIEAAEMVATAGNLVLIANAREDRVLERLFDGESLGTVFLPAKRRMKSRKRWLRFGSRSMGLVIVDAGAQRALVKAGKSLLPSGVVRVEGTFARGDLVSVCDEERREFARGLINYNAEDMAKIAGKKTSALRRILGHAPYDESIHRDHLVLNK